MGWKTQSSQAQPTLQQQQEQDRNNKDRDQSEYPYPQTRHFKSLNLFRFSLENVLDDISLVILREILPKGQQPDVLKQGVNKRGNGGVLCQGD